MKICFVLSFLITTLHVRAHMHLTSPPPLASKDNPNTPQASIDYSYDSPLLADGSNFPCKGYLKLLGSPAGASVASWAAGSTQSFTTAGGAAHGGGSCQASLSEDGGKTWKVVKSFVGSCPVAGQAFSFTVPSDTKAGNAVFAWSWFNQIGNREMYMNCASVTITGSGGGGLSTYPDMFAANIDNGCSTLEGKDLVFPDPGKDVQNASTAGTAPPVGNCPAAAVAPPSGGSSSVPVPSSIATVTPPTTSSTSAAPTGGSIGAVPPPIVSSGTTITPLSTTEQASASTSASLPLSPPPPPPEPATLGPASPSNTAPASTPSYGEKDTKQSTCLCTCDAPNGGTMQMVAFVDIPNLQISSPDVTPMASSGSPSNDGDTASSTIINAGSAVANDVADSTIPTADTAATTGYHKRIRSHTKLGGHRRHHNV